AQPKPRNHIFVTAKGELPIEVNTPPVGTAFLRRDLGDNWHDGLRLYAQTKRESRDCAGQRGMGGSIVTQTQPVQHEPLTVQLAYASPRDDQQVTTFWRVWTIILGSGDFVAALA